MKFSDFGDKGPEFKIQDVAEGSQRVDSLVTDALRIMKGSEVSDAVSALKTVLGNREYNGRRGHYNFYVKQIMDMSGQQGVAEGFNGEYDDEAGMAKSNLRTMARAVNGLLDTISDDENLPEWAQEKIAKAEMMVTGVWDYLLSQEEQGIDPKVDEASLAQMRDYFSQPDNNTVKVDNQYGAPERKQAANVPPEIQMLINKMYRVGKITPQEFDVLKRFQAKTGINVGLKVKEAGNPYAIGMSQAMKSTGDEPPLKKSTINKAHKIARAIEKGE
jgi:hypothetical protein